MKRLAAVAAVTLIAACSGTTPTPQLIYVTPAPTTAVVAVSARPTDAATAPVPSHVDATEGLPSRTAAPTETSATNPSPTAETFTLPPFPPASVTPTAEATAVASASEGPPDIRLGQTARIAGGPGNNDHWELVFKELRFGDKAFPAALNVAKPAKGWQYLAVWVQDTYLGVLSSATMKSDYWQFLGTGPPGGKPGGVYSYPAISIVPNDPTVDCKRGELRGYTWVYEVPEDFSFGSTTLSFDGGKTWAATLSFQVGVGGSIT